MAQEAAPRLYPCVPDKPSHEGGLVNAIFFLLRYRRTAKRNFGQEHAQGDAMGVSARVASRDWMQGTVNRRHLGRVL